MSKDVVEGIIKSLNKKFGKESPLTTTRGKALEYLGLTLDYTKKGQVKISMFVLCKRAGGGCTRGHARCGKDTCKQTSTINLEGRKLPEDSTSIPSYLAKLLYLCSRTRQDIQMAVAILCTGVKSTNSDDYKKLACGEQYLIGTQDLILTIEPGEYPNLWVDILYSVHPDMQSHSRKSS